LSGPAAALALPAEELALRHRAFPARHLSGFPVEETLTHSSCVLEALRVPVPRGASRIHRPRRSGSAQRLPQAHSPIAPFGDAAHGSWTGRGSDNGILPGVLQDLLDTGYELLPVETAPGDVILFHGNTIHGSDDNGSPASRIALVATMNTKRNSPDPRFNKPGAPILVPSSARDPADYLVLRRVIDDAGC
jgi:hypothetical protein